MVPRSPFSNNTCSLFYLDFFLTLVDYINEKLLYFLSI